MSKPVSEDDILSNLNKYFAYETLRPGQLHIINKILENRDILLSKEYEFGKALCFQLAGLLQDGIVLVVSPLLSRVEDKYQQLSAFPNVKCAFLNNNTLGDDNHENVADLRKVLIQKHKVLDDLQNVENSGLKFLFMTLEYFINSKKLRRILKGLYEKQLLQSIVFDEAHNIVQWSQSFRKESSKLGDLRNSYSKIPFLCLTGPVNTSKLEIINKTLNLRNPYILNELSIKENISFKVMYKGRELVASKLALFLKHNYYNKSGLIYCQTKEECIGLSKELHGINVRNVCYFTSLTDDDKAWLRWINNYGIIVIYLSGLNVEVRLEKVDFVVHTIMPNSLDTYMQEIGKIGKDNKYGDCIMFYNIADYDEICERSNELQKERSKRANSELKKQMQSEFKSQRRELFDVVIYAENISLCRQIFLLRYFNENIVAEPCGVCDVCLLMRESFVIEVGHVLRKILMTIWTINRHQKINIGTENFLFARIENVIGLLQGSVKKRFVDSWFVKEWFFSSFGFWDQQVLHRFIFALLSSGFAAVNHVLNEKKEISQNLIITAKGQAFIKSNSEFNLPFFIRDAFVVKWLNVDHVKEYFLKDLEGVLAYHSLHDKTKCVFEWSRKYIESLYQAAPGTWDEYKAIKFNFRKTLKSELDEDLFTVCLMYHRILRSNFTTHNIFINN